MNRLLLATAALLAALMPVTPASAASVSHQVTPSGQYLYEFEALLKQTVGEGTYGGVSICASHPAPCSYGWFYKQLAIPNEDILVYEFTFTNLGRSTLHLMPPWFTVKGTVAGVPPWGNRTEPVVINGRLISCNGANTEFLVGNLQAFGAGPSGDFETGIMDNGGGWYCQAP